MSELYDEDGNLVENAMTPEEVEEKVKEAVEENKGVPNEEVETLKTELEQIKTALEDKEKEIEELANSDDKTKNLVALRKAKEQAEKEKNDISQKLEELKTDLTGKVEEVEKKITSEKFDSAVQKLSGSDNDLATKIKSNYDAFKGVPKDDKEMNERLQNAYILATGAMPASPLSGGVVSGGGGTPPGMPKPGKLSEPAKEVGRAMGLTDQELEKHGK